MFFPYDVDVADVFIDRSRFAAALRGRREALGLSKRQLASRAQISDAYLGSLEQGGSIPGIDVLAKLASALKVRPDELLADYGLQLRASDIPELEDTYSALTPPDQYALLHIGRALREARERFGAEEGKGDSAGDSSEEPQSLDADPLTTEEFDQGRRQGKLAADPLRDADRPESDEPA